MRVTDPLTKVPLVDRSRSAGPAGVATTSQWRADSASVRSAIGQGLPGSRPMLKRTSGMGRRMSTTGLSASSAP